MFTKSSCLLFKLHFLRAHFLQPFGGTPRAERSFDLSRAWSLNSKPLSDRSASFLFDSAKRAKVFWQYAVTCHAFFRVKEASDNSGSLNSASAFPNGVMSRRGQPQPFQQQAVSSRLRRSLSMGPSTAAIVQGSSPCAGLERTMSTLFELRRRSSKSLERGFSRCVLKFCQ